MELRKRLEQVDIGKLRPRYALNDAVFVMSNYDPEALCDVVWGPQRKERTGMHSIWLGAYLGTLIAPKDLP